MKRVVSMGKDNKEKERKLIEILINLDYDISNINPRDIASKYYEFLHKEEAL